MICTQVIGEDAAVAFAGAQGQLQLNVMRPIVINNYLHSARILADGAGTFRRYTIEGRCSTGRGSTSCWTAR